jgi:hypothetical protein
MVSSASEEHHGARMAPDTTREDAVGPGFRTQYQTQCRRHRSTPNSRKPRSAGLSHEADARTRTGDPFITSEVLCQLSYVGAAREV